MDSLESLSIELPLQRGAVKI